MILNKTNRKHGLVASLFLIVPVSINVSHATDQRDESAVFDVQIYDNFDSPGGYTLEDYSARWINPYGLGEMAESAHGDTRTFQDGTFSITATPFLTAYDYSVFDHIKYFALGQQNFPMPEKGSITFSADIEAMTPGTLPGRVIEGTYIQSGQPYRAVALEGQQACATLHMIDFTTGQLFDWLVSGNKALALTERLPSLVTNSPIPAGIDEIYTQVIDEFDISPGPHNYAIRYIKKNPFDEVEFLIDGKVVASYKNIGIPLDKLGVDFITYPSLGDGELLKDQLQSFSIAHGVFSLLDAFPFQHPDAPEYAVSIPISNRIFGQGVEATFDNFKVTTKTIIE
ncbi:MAG: DUF6081 family protein [Gammaproteobacteria bacterium]|jgi:hypothetical protein